MMYHGVQGFGSAETGQRSFSSVALQGVYTLSRSVAPPSIGNALADVFSRPNRLEVINNGAREIGRRSRRMQRDVTSFGAKLSLSSSFSVHGAKEDGIWRRVRRGIPHQRLPSVVVSSSSSSQASSNGGGSRSSHWKPKSDVYLLRSDGHSCARETVTCRYSFPRVHVFDTMKE